MIKINKIKIVFLIGILLFGLGLVSASSGFAYSPNVQYNSPGSYDSFSQKSASDYWPALSNRDTCEASTDFLMFIRPGSCNPLVVRSDLLEEQNVPVFCKVDVVKVNPLIDISELKSVKFEGEYGKYVAGVSFHPNSEAIYSRENYLDNPLINDVGYVVVLLKRTEREADMPDEIKINLTGVLRYDAEGVFGAGKSDYYLGEDKNWEANYKDNSLFKGKAYLRLENVYDGGARVSIYRDEDTLMNTFNLKVGDEAQTYYLPGFYCKAKINVGLEDIVTGVKKVRLEIDDNKIWLVEGERFLDNKCKVSKINAEDDSVLVSCRGQNPVTLKIGESNEKENSEDTVESLNDATLDELSKNIFKRAREEAYDIGDLYGGVTNTGGDITWGARAMLELGDLADKVGLKVTAVEIYNRVVNNYPDSGYANSAKDKLDSVGLPIISHEGIFIKLISVNAPNRDDVSAEFVLQNNSNNVELEHQGLIQEKELFADGKFKLVKFERDKIELQYITGGDKKNEKVVLNSGEFYEYKVGDDKYKLRLKNIRSDMIAKIHVSADMPSTYSEADFNFAVGIEKRAIQLTPEKTKEIISKLDKTITKWESTTASLGKVVKSMKAVCFTTSAILIAKNLVQGFGGSATARQEIMPMYYKKCEKESGKDRVQFDKCLEGYETDIEKDIESRQEVIKGINAEFDVLQKQNTYEKTDVVNRDAVAGIIIGKYFSEGINYQVKSVVDGKETFNDKIIGGDILEKASLSDARDLLENKKILDSNPSQIARDEANANINRIASRLEQRKNLQGGGDVLSVESKGAKNWINFVNVEYYMQGSAKGKVHVVPIPRDYDGKTGFYAVVSEEDYKKSGDFNDFWIRNIGTDLHLDIYDDLGTSIPDVGKFLSDPYKILGIDEEESRKLVVKARDAIKTANSNYGKSKFIVDGRQVIVDMAGSSFGETRCQDFMSPSDCAWLFNTCDPVLCPSSRCDLGGRFRVENVIQSGIIGSIALCLPNFGNPSEGGVVVPICVSGVHAGLDAYLSILKSYRGCLEESLETGRSVGICDEINSIYLCEFFWRQAGPFLETGLMHFVEKSYGQGAKGGGEYLTVQDAWKQAGDSVDYMKNNYAVNAVNAFTARSSGDIGTSFCKAFVSAKYPNKGFFDNLIEPDSPVQFHAWFDEIKFTDVTVPATSQYKVFYHIWAGRDNGVNYQVYLKNPEKSAYVSVRDRVVVDTNYLPQEGYISETKDFTAPAGYQELCVRIDGNDHCDFKKVSTSFALNYASDLYYEDQLKKDVTTEKECVSGSASAFSLLQPNVEEGVQDMITPSLEKRGIVRICSSTNPGTGTDEARWKNVGICGRDDVTCWLDKNSVENVVNDKNIEAGATGVVDKINEMQVDTTTAKQIISEAEKLIEDIGSSGESVQDMFEAVEDKKDLNDLGIGKVVGDLESVGKSKVLDKVKAEAGYLLFRIYAVLGEKKAGYDKSIGEIRNEAEELESYVRAVDEVVASAEEEGDEDGGSVEEEDSNGESETSSENVAEEITNLNNIPDKYKINIGGGVYETRYNKLKGLFEFYSNPAPSGITQNEFKSILGAIATAETSMGDNNPKNLLMGYGDELKDNEKYEGDNNQVKFASEMLRDVFENKNNLYEKCNDEEGNNKIKCVFGIYNSENSEYVDKTFSYYLQWKEYFESQD